MSDSAKYDFTAFSLLFTRISPLLVLGQTRSIEVEDLGRIPDNAKVEILNKKFNAAWEKEKLKSPNKRSIWTVCFKVVGYEVVVCAFILQAIVSGSGFQGPLFLEAINKSLNGTKVLPEREYWTLIALTFVIPILGTICGQHAAATMQYMSMQLRNALTSAVYRKVLLMKSSQLEAGLVTNLLVNDVRQIEMLFGALINVIMLPAVIAVALALIYQQVRVSMFVGMAFVVGISIAIAFSVVLMIMNFQAFLKLSDARIKLTTEVMNGIRIIKYYGWEDAFKNSIEDIRNEELDGIQKTGYYWAMQSLFTQSVQSALPIVVFSAYVALGHQLDYVTAFTTLGLFQLVQEPVMQLPGTAQYLASALVAMGRIQVFLDADEISTYVIREAVLPSSSSPATEGKEGASAVVIEFTQASLGWIDEKEAEAAAVKAKAEAEAEAAASTVGAKSDTITPATPQPSDVAGDNYVALSVTEENPTDRNSSFHADVADGEARINRSLHTLVDVSFSVKQGQLVAVVGKVGSGKSSLLSALLEELNLLKGSVSMIGSVAYHQQQPWILNATIEANILFGLPYDESAFKAVLEASSLTTDLNSFPAGLKTEIGEKGINLSGGQKARISFARALYRNADIYLLDDPLSAVDAHVGDHLFHKAIKGALKGKTVILVTHQVQFLKECDLVVVLEEGHVKGVGTYDELKSQGIDVDATGEHYDDDTDEEEEEGEGTEKDVQGQPDAADGSAGGEVEHSDINLQVGTAKSRSRSKSDGDDGRSRARTRSKSFSAENEKGRSSSSSKNAPGANEQSGGLMTEEEKESGTVDAGIFWYFISAGSPYLVLGTFLFVLGGTVAGIAGTYNLQDWGTAVVASYMQKGRPLNNPETMVYLHKYAWLMMIPVGCSFIASVLAVIQTLLAGRTFHKRILSRLMAAPVSFFDTTPIGRIMNRFSNDQRNCDIGIAPISYFFMSTLAQALGCIGAIAYASKGTFLVVVVPLGIAYNLIQKRYRKGNIDLQRLTNVTTSPILIDFQQVLSGVSSIRAFKAEQQFVVNMETNVEKQSLCWVLNMYVHDWLSMRLGILGAFITFFIYLLESFDKSVLPTGQAALALVYCQQLPMLMGAILGTFAAVESALNSVERMKHYITTTPQEEDPDKAGSLVTVDASWPSKGEIRIEGAVMGYRDGPDVLKGLTFDSLSNEKIGVVGRTGSGKSTLMVALFRIENLRSGKIFIDDVDIATVSLKTLRSKLGIIPQDPVMFSSTLRFNLDPFNEHSDQKLWDVLQVVNMKDAVSNLAGKLQEMVSEGGSNFSSGQRQLICFARALLCSPKILLLDEATASVDNETDTLIQSMIRNRFVDSTVLTIAHRLNTIIDADRIMVLDAGKLAEADTPTALLAIPGGVFAGLWAQFEQNHDTADRSKK